MKKNLKEQGQIDWMITLVPLGIVIALCVLFFFMPEQSNQVLSQIRFFFGDTLGTYYLIIGLGIFVLSLFWQHPSTEILYLVIRTKSQNIHSFPGAQ